MRIVGIPAANTFNSPTKFYEGNVIDATLSDTFCERVCIDLARRNIKGHSHLAKCPVHPATSQILNNTWRTLLMFSFHPCTLFPPTRIYNHPVVLHKKCRKISFALLHHKRKVSYTKLNLYYLNVYKEKKKKIYWPGTLVSHMQRTCSI